MIEIDAIEKANLLEGTINKSKSGAEEKKIEVKYDAGKFSYDKRQENFGH